MNNQFFVAIGVAVVASVLMTGLASTINAQSNMTGANMTGANMTGANMTGVNMSMPSGTTGDGGAVMMVMETAAVTETAAKMEKMDRTS